MTLPQLLGLCLAWLVAIMSPGPDLLVILQQSLTRSRREGVLAAAGVLTGLTLWLVAAIVGLASLLEMFPQVLDGLQVAGGALLITLGTLGLRQARAQHRSGDPGLPPVASERGGFAVRSRGLSAYTKGLGINLSNPKALVFFAAILAPFLPRTLGLTGIAFVIFILLLLATIWFVSVAIVASWQPLAYRLQRATRALDIAASGLFILTGVAFCIAAVWP